MEIDLVEIQNMKDKEEAMQHLMLLLVQTLYLMGYERIAAVEIAEGLAERLAQKRLN